MFKKTIYLFFILISSFAIFSQNDSSKHIITPHASPTLRFTENKGQWGDNILFRAQLDGGALFLESNKLTFNFYDKKSARSFHGSKAIKQQPKDHIIKGHAFSVSFEGCNPKAQIQKLQLGSDYENFFIGNDKSKWASDVKNYHQIFLRNIYNNIDYEVITTNNGIKYNFHVKPNSNPSIIKLKYEGVDKIKLKDGALIIKLDVNEVIEQKPYAYQLINGRVKQVTCNYKFENNTLSFDFPNSYNKNYELVIDPILVFAAQSGSLADNFGMTATYDAQGNLYTGGTAFGIGYPTTPGAYSSLFFGPAYGGNTDVVVTKYNSIGTMLLYSTYFGGNLTETINSMVVDYNNNLCFFGATSSTNIPTTAGAFDNSFNGGNQVFFLYNGSRYINGSDIYLAKFNSSGTGLLACTYYGGSDNDGLNYSNTSVVLGTFSFIGGLPLAIPPATGPVTVSQPSYDSLQTNYGDQSRGEIQVDVLNNIYITSSTRSNNIPMVNGFDNTLGGKQDALIAKFNPSLTNLLHASYIGGSSNDAGCGLIIQSNNEIYITGGTCSQDFPYASGGYQSTYAGGNADGYVIRTNPSGNSVLNGTYFGTNLYDQSFFVQSDKQKNIYIYGQSLGNIPVLIAPTSTVVFSVAGTHQFISMLNQNLSTLKMSTVFGFNTTGGHFDISPAAFSVDKCKNIYLSGWGSNFLDGTAPPLSGMPLAFPTQSTTSGNDFYFMGLDSNATTLKYGSYFGGNSSEEHVDGGTSRFDPRGVIYQSICAGCGGPVSGPAHQDFPVTPYAWPCPTTTPCITPNMNTQNHNCNNGVVKINFQLQLAISTINTNTVAGCSPVTISFTNATAPTGTNSSFIWYFNNGTSITTNTSNINPTVTYTTTGTYTVSLVVKDPTTCNVSDSSVTFITVYPKPTANFTINPTPCTNSITTLNSSTGSFGTNPYVWNFGNGSPTSTLITPSYTYPTSGNYTVSLTTTDVNGCTSIKTNTISVFNFMPGVVGSGSICRGYTTNVTASGGTSYTWSPATNLSTTNSASPIANPSITTIYTVQIDNNTPGYTCSQTLTTQVIVFPKPVANFNYTTNPCGGGVNYFDLSASNIAAWQWTLSATATSTIQNPYNFYYNGGTHTITLIATDNNGCKDTSNKVITVLIPPPITISGNSIICKGNKAGLSASGGVSYQWTPTVSLDVSTIPYPTASPTVSTQYSVVITTSNSCVFLLTTNVNVTQLSTTPIAANAVPIQIVQGGSSTLTYIGDPGATVIWSPNNHIVPTTGYSVIATPDRNTTYTVTITNGPCKEILYVYVEVNLNGCLDTDAFIPNTFTPNGDGNNDILYVRGLKVNDVYFAVYNRWGELVWETNDKTKGWDGIYKGKPADVGVFGWYLKAKCFNGEEAFKKGNVTLIR